MYIYSIFLNPVCVCVFTENSGAVDNMKINMNVDVEKSDDSDDGSNDYVNTKGMAHIGTLTRI